MWVQNDSRCETLQTIAVICSGLELVCTAAARSNHGLPSQVKAEAAANLQVSRAGVLPPTLHVLWQLRQATCFGGHETKVTASADAWSVPGRLVASCLVRQGVLTAIMSNKTDLADVSHALTCNLLLQKYVDFECPGPVSSAVRVLNAGSLAAAGDCSAAWTSEWQHVTA